MEEEEMKTVKGKQLYETVRLHSRKLPSVPGWEGETQAK